MGEAGTRKRGGGGSLSRRTFAVSLVLSVIIGTGFLFLALAIDALRQSETRANHAVMVLGAANRLERLALDIETTQRGFIITGEPQYLTQWRQARTDFGPQADTLESLALAGDDGQGGRAKDITAAGKSYISDYSIPLVNRAQRDLRSARALALSEEGKRRIDALRTEFSRFRAHEDRVFETGSARADAYASRAVIAASVSVAGSIALILFSWGYLAASVVRPVRRASAMAGTVAGGDLSVRMLESGPAEVGSLERSFNAMTDSLETSRDEVHRVAAEQAALRRVATLVARGVAPPAVFSAVASETGRLLDAEAIHVAQFEPDGTVTVAGSWARPGTQGLAVPAGSRLSTGEDTVAGRVQRTGQPARVSGYDDADGDIPAWAQEHGIHSSVGGPIVVEGRLWGVVAVSSAAEAQHPADTEKRLLAFTELAAMAVANAESRAQLAASRARVVATADETRRRIERDLHDGTQQRLISLALELRAAEAQTPPEQKNLVEQWSRTADGLGDVIDELREMTRGLHPAVLERGGLGPALRGLARRAAVPVELDVGVSGRLPERVEVAAYYVVSEALANAAKHARASFVEVDVALGDGVLRLLVKDDGVGGAQMSGGSGLIGLSDRVEALGGRIDLTSPSGGGTTLLVTIPVHADPAGG
jgi:signal transduction histidine kinase